MLISDIGYLAGTYQGYCHHHGHAREIAQDLQQRPEPMFAVPPSTKEAIAFRTSGPLLEAEATTFRDAAMSRVSASGQQPAVCAFTSTMNPGWRCTGAGVFWLYHQDTGHRIDGWMKVGRGCRRSRKRGGGVVLPFPCVYD